MKSILNQKNIIVNNKSCDKETILKKIGSVLQDSGYCTSSYAQGILEKEKVFNTYIGNEVAIPHGIESVRNEVISTGIVVMTFPDGVNWGSGNTAKLVIGIAAKEDEQVDVLAHIAVTCMELDNVEKIVHSSAEEIKSIFSSELDADSNVI